MRKMKKVVGVCLCLIMVLNLVLSGTTIKVQADEKENITIYLIDKTNEKWLGNDSAAIVLVDNTHNHKTYDMTKMGKYTWSATIPSSATNITFNRLNEQKNTQWNSWSAGGRDGKTIYLAEGSEYGKWISEDDYGFKEGDIVYLDLSSF